jgi:endonuclease YncB( thermonuclease family)
MDCEIPLFSFNGQIKEVYVCDVYDGDTFTCIFKLEGKAYKFKCRMMGYDSPEIRKYNKDK